MVRHETIQYALHESDILTADAHEGSCGPIARAIHEVFDGTYVVVYDVDGNPRHASVAIDGTVYDGTGEISPSALHMLFTRGAECEQGVGCEHLRQQESLDQFRRDRSLRQDVAASLEGAVSELNDHS